MPPAIDLVGKVFGKLTVLSYVGSFNRKRYYLCECSCSGNRIKTASGNLLKGDTKSCGCLSREILIKRNTKHGFAKRENPHHLYVVLFNMRDRCYNPKSVGYKNYGGRGITVCEEWMGPPEIFINWSLLNGWQDGLEIDRIDVNGNYEPTNCRFVTNADNHRNMRRCYYFTYNEETACLAELVRKYSKIPYNLVRSRILDFGWNLEEAMTLSPNSVKHCPNSKLKDSYI